MSSTSNNSIISTSDEPRRAICSCAGLNRYGILILAVVFFSMLMSSVIAFNATFVAMMDKTTSPLYNSSLGNDTEIQWDSNKLAMADKRFSYGFSEKALTFSATYFGSMICTFPVSSIVARFGAHKVMTVIGAGSVILCAASPFAIAHFFPAFVVIRFFQGLCLCNLFPVVGIIVNDWAPIIEKGVFVAVLTGFVEMSSLFTMPISGVLAVQVSWPSVFYVHAAVLAVVTFLWGVYYRDQPKQHPFVAENEFRKISHGKLPSAGPVVHPVKKILRTISIWAVWIAVIGNFLVSQFSISYSTIYMKYVLGYSPMTAGFLIMIPLALLLVIKLVTGLLSDRITCISEIGKLRLFNSIALLGAGIFFIILALLPTYGHFADVILVAIPIALLGFSVGGYPKAAVMISRQHSPFVMSVVQIFAMLALTIGGFVVPAITTDDTVEQWRAVFMIYAAILVVANTIFIALTRAEPAKWSFDDSTESETSTNTSTPSPA